MSFFSILRIVHKNLKNGCYFKGLHWSRPNFRDLKGPRPRQDRDFSYPRSRSGLRDPRPAKNDLKIETETETWSRDYYNGWNISQIRPLVIRSKKVIFMISVQCFVIKIKGKIGKRSTTFCTVVKFTKWSDFIENGLKLIGLLCRLKKNVYFATHTMSWYRSMEGSRVNTHRRHIGNDLWPLGYSSS